MSSPFERYQTSGFFRPLTLALFAGATVGAVAAAWLYQLLIRWIPLIYLNLIITIGFAAALGAVAAAAVNRGHCRNRTLAILLALPLALGAVGASHYWEYRNVLGHIVDKNPGLTLAQAAEEVSFGQYVDARKEVGWSVSNHGGSGSQINGVVVYGVWGVEALLFLGFVLSMTLKAAAAPYCERCNRWCEDKGISISGMGLEELEPLIARADLDGLIALGPPADPRPNTAVVLMGALCSSCDSTGFVTISRKWGVAKKNGKTEIKEKVLVKSALLRTDQRKHLESRIAGLAAPAPAESVQKIA